MIETQISQNGKFLVFKDQIINDYLAHKINQSRILVSYLNVDFKPEVVEEYLKHLEELFRQSTREPSRVCWSALTDRSFSSDGYILNGGAND